MPGDDGRVDTAMAGTGNRAITIDATGVPYRVLNNRVRETIAAGAREITLRGVNGQYYIGDGLRDSGVTIQVDGVPGNDLGAFMDGPVIIVRGNGQDNIANTMNDGKIVIHGNGGDVLGYGMRGGKLFVRGDVGYRVGIHMKGFRDKIPHIVIGGKAGDFLGEYMAGGVLVVLGLKALSSARQAARPVVGKYCATGMHGGVLYIRDPLGKDSPVRKSVGKEVGIFPATEQDMNALRPVLEEFCRDCGVSPDSVLDQPFNKIIPVTRRPYGNLYTY